MFKVISGATWAHAKTTFPQQGQYKQCTAPWRPPVNVDLVSKGCVDRDNPCRHAAQVVHGGWRWWVSWLRREPATDRRVGGRAAVGRGLILGGRACGQALA